MDIQSVIVSFNELNNTKNAIANAIREKGISSAGRFSNFASEIKSIQAGPSGRQYQNLLDNLSNNNIFRKGRDNTIEAVGKVDDSFEIVKDNNVEIYSLYTIENVNIADGPYKSRIRQIADNINRPISIDYQTRGYVNYQRLTLSVTPIEANNINGTVAIKYTTNGQEHTVVMQIQDRPVAEHRNNVYWLTQLKFNPAEGGKDLKQSTSMQNAEEGYAIFDEDTSTLRWSETRPSVFDMLNRLSGGQGIDAVLAFEKNGALIESMPVKLVKSIQTKRIPMEPNQNAAVLELENDKLVFHYSDNAGRLNAKCVVATKEWTTTTDASILDKVKKLNEAEYDYMCIAIDENGNPISYEEAKAAGML